MQIYCINYHLPVLVGTKSELKCYLHTVMNLLIPTYNNPNSKLVMTRTVKIAVKYAKRWALSWLIHPTPSDQQVFDEQDFQDGIKKPLLILTIP